MSSSSGPFECTYLNAQQEEIQVETSPRQDKLVRHRHEDRRCAVAEDGDRWTVDGDLRFLCRRRRFIVSCIPTIHASHLDLVVIAFLVVRHDDKSPSRGGSG